MLMVTFKHKRGTCYTSIPVSERATAKKYLRGLGFHSITNLTIEA